MRSRKASTGRSRPPEPERKSGARRKAPTRAKRREPAAAERKLAEYRRKRDPTHTSEPFEAGKGDGFFVVQKHAARRLHYDFRLAMGGVLVSWAVPKGPSYDTRDKRLAVHVEDHPLSYSDFEGTIPEGEYGAGSVIVWDRGSFRLREGSVAKGSLKLDLAGKKLVGGWALVRMKGEGDQWLLIKEKDEHADPDRSVVDEEPESVASGLTVEEIGERKGVRQWNSGVRRAIEALPQDKLQAARMPRTPGFMKARLTGDVPRGEGWLYEIKLDGVRALAVRKEGRVQLVTRNLKEVAFRYPEVTEALERLPGGDFVMDGEIVAFDEEGRSRFELLQGRIHLAGSDRIAAAARAVPAFYYAFDLPYAEGSRLEDAPLVDRKAVLKRWLSQASRRIRFSDHVEGSGSEFYRLACGRGLEGIIAKRADSPYRAARTGDWLKVKCLNQQEFVIGGYTPPQGGRNHFGALLVGVYEGEKLVYAGKVGTGFTEKDLTAIHPKLEKLERDTPPFADPPRERGVRWVKPKLVAEIRFTEWTSDGKLRHPAFLGLRDDKRPEECVRERPQPASGRGPRQTTREAAAHRTPAPHNPGERKGSGTSRSTAGVTAAVQAGKLTRGAPKLSGRSAKSGRGTGTSRPASRSAIRTRTRAAPSRAGIRAKPPARRAGGIRGRGAAASVAEREITVTNPDKVFYPQAGITKGEVVEYYRQMAPMMLPYLEARPLTLVRFPNGIEHSSFFQKNQPDSRPDWIPTVKVRSEGGRRDVEYLLCNDAPTLVYVANLGSIDLHPWASRLPDLERPDYVVWDLDPPEGGFPKAAEVAPRVRETLERAGLPPFLKTSGGKGLHLYVPLLAENDHDTVRDFAEVIARLVTEANPRTTTLERAKAARGGKVYVDFLQNGRGKTVVAPYSLRAKEPATVSMPITWEEFEEGARPQDFTLRSVPGIVAGRGDAWDGFREEPASLAEALTRLSR